MANSFIALDVGRARVGMAAGNDQAKLASPLFSTPTEQAIEKLKQLITEHNASVIVVGLPRNLSGDETEQTAWVRQWVTGLKEEIGLPVYMQDEALTTKVAETEAKTHKKPADIDALAATIILQDFLDSPESERVSW